MRARIFNISIKFSKILFENIFLAFIVSFIIRLAQDIVIASDNTSTELKVFSMTKVEFLLLIDIRSLDSLSLLLSTWQS